MCFMGFGIAVPKTTTRTQKRERLSTAIFESHNIKDDTIQLGYLHIRIP